MDINDVRVGDTDRADAVDLLGRHVAAGRLTWEEFEARCTAAWSARTRTELAVLFADQPALASPAPARAVGARVPTSRTIVLAAVLSAVLFVVLLGLATPGWAAVTMRACM